MLTLSKRRRHDCESHTLTAKSNQSRSNATSSGVFGSDLSYFILIIVAGSDTCQGKAARRAHVEHNHKGSDVMPEVGF